MQQERLWIVKMSLAITACVFFFFIAAPGVLGFRLDYDEAIRIIQIVTPVFVGYIGLATAFLFNAPANFGQTIPADDRLLRLLLRGPVYLLAGGLATVIAVFWYTNRTGGPPKTGMTVDQLAWFISAFLGLLSASTGLIVVKLFPIKEKE